jgi:hypothetical protein
MTPMGKKVGRLDWEGQAYEIQEDKAGPFTLVRGERCRVRSLGSKVADLKAGATVEVMNPVGSEVLFWGQLSKDEIEIG